VNNPIVEALTGCYQLIYPEMLLIGAACVIFLGGAFRPGRFWAGAALLALAGAAALLPVGHGIDYSYRAAVFAGPISNDAFAYLVRGIALASGAVLVLLSWNEVKGRQASDYYACLLLVVAGVNLTGAANDLVTLFVALELISIPTYVMLYLPRHDQPAQEAALKYFLLSVFSSALLLFGFSYLYGVAGTTNLPALFDAINHPAGGDTVAGRESVPVIAQVGVLMVVAGIGFRITAVPFHFYAPDVYQGTATVMAALLAVIPKIAGFAALLRVLGFLLPPEVIDAGRPAGTALSADVPILLYFLAAVTMTLGNLFALQQDNLKRLLAYSSVAHAGYMLVALAAAPYLGGVGAVSGLDALLFYLVAYGAMTVGAFAVIAHLHTPENPVESVDDLAGLSRSHPGVALLMVVFLFSLIGIPLTAGFLGKLWVFLGALAVNSDGAYAAYAPYYNVLALVGMINAAVGGWYYLRVIAVMYLRSPIRPLPRRAGWSGLATLWVCAALTIGLSVPPGATWLLGLTRQATSRGTPPSPPPQTTQR
jgi:NADH-quinone oxidoreductase subunit N